MEPTYEGKQNLKNGTVFRVCIVNPTFNFQLSKIHIDTFVIDFIHISQKISLLKDIWVPPIV